MASLLALISSTLWGSADFFGGRLSKRFPAIVVLAVTQIIGLVFGVVLVFGLGETSKISDTGYLIPGILAGLLGYVGLACLYAGLSTGRMGVVSPISSLSAVVPLTIALVGGEVLKPLQALGVAIALAGAFCASGPEISQGLSLKPIVLAVGAAVGFGSALSFMAVGSKTSALLTMVTMRAATFFVSAAILIKRRTFGGFSKKEAPTLLFMGVADFLANFLLGVSTHYGLVSLVMVLGSLYPIATALLAYRFLQERLHRVQYVGIVLAVAGVALISAS